MPRAWWKQIEVYLGGIVAGIALALVAYEMFVRVFVPRFSIDWGLEVTVFLIIWAMFLSGGVLVRDNGHIRADLVIRKLPPKALSSVEIFNNLVGLVFCFVMAWLGWEVVEFAIDLGEESGSSLRVPMAWYFASLPVGMILMGTRFLVRFINSIRKFGREEILISDSHSFD